ncbi:hypothetical protein GCM10027027_13960 [Neomicrococcus lactis]|uniref:Uncharacterized protein n=1 Tax=Neomicrococcus lactis TaxID=732241 RepID=A0A7W9DCP4_9MICC|nr:hypothetical protein [Neomicrococcus lactis]
MSTDPHPRSIALADLTSPGGPDLAPAAGGLPADVSVSKSFGSSTCSYGRGKGLSIAALCNEMPGQKAVPAFRLTENTRGHLGSHLGVNRGSIRRLTLYVPFRAALAGGGHHG